MSESGDAGPTVVTTLERSAANHPDPEIESQLPRLEARASKLHGVAQTETAIVSAAVAERAVELSEVTGRATDRQRYATSLQAMGDRFETAAGECSLSDAGA